MNTTFTILQDFSIKKIIVSEQLTTEVLAIKSVEELQKKSPLYVNRVVYRLITHPHDKFSQGYAYNWEVIESPFTDKSSLGSKYSTSETKGEAILRMLKDGFEVIVDGVQMK